MFIKLTGSGEQIRVNVSQIVLYSSYKEGSSVSLTGIGPEEIQWIYVDETPEEIDAKIYAATGQKVGGGH